MSKVISGWLGACAGLLLLVGCGESGSSADAGGAPSGSCQESSLPNDETVPATVHEGIVGEYDLIYAQSAPGGPFEDGDTVHVTIQADGTLTIGDRTLCAPFHQKYGESTNEHELIWYDASAQIGYAASPNSEVGLREINVGDYTSFQDEAGRIPSFLGQLKEPGEEPEEVDLSAVAALTGSYGVASVEEGTYSGSSLIVENDGAIFWEGFDYDAEMVQSVETEEGRVTIDVKPRIVELVERTEQLVLEHDGSVVTRFTFRPYAPTDDQLVVIQVTRLGDAN